MQTNANHNTTKEIQPKAQIVLKKKHYKVKSKKAIKPDEKQTDNLGSAQLERRRSGKVKDLLSQDTSSLVSDALRRKRAELKNLQTDNNSEVMFLPIAGNNTFYFYDTKANPRCIPVNEFINASVFSLDEAFMSSVDNLNQKIYWLPINYRLHIRSDGWWKVCQYQNMGYGSSLGVQDEPEPEQHLGLLSCIFIALFTIVITYFYFIEPKETKHDDIQTLSRSIRHLHWAKH